jgi:hypothetical protein
LVSRKSCSSTKKCYCIKGVAGRITWNRLCDAAQIDQCMAEECGRRGEK